MTSPIPKCFHCGQEILLFHGVALSRDKTRIANIVEQMPGITMDEIAERIGTKRENVRSHIAQLNIKLEQINLRLVGRFGYRVITLGKKK